MGSSMDSNQYTCPGCFEVFDYGYTEKQFLEANEEIDEHLNECKEYKKYRKRIKEK